MIYATAKQAEYIRGLITKKDFGENSELYEEAETFMGDIQNRSIEEAVALIKDLKTLPWLR